MSILFKYYIMYDIVTPKVSCWMCFVFDVCMYCMKIIYVFDLKHQSLQNISILI